MPQVLIADGRVEDLPDDFFNHIQQALQNVGLPDDTGKMAANVFKAALDDGYKQRVLSAAETGTEPWTKLAQVIGQLDQSDTADAMPAAPPAPPAPPTAASAMPRASILAALAGGGPTAGMAGAGRPQPSRIPHQNPAGLSALLGPYLNGGR